MERVPNNVLISFLSLSKTCENFDRKRSVRIFENTWEDNSDWICLNLVLWDSESTSGCAGLFMEEKEHFFERKPSK
jgi:hypothetical protein